MQAHPPAALESNTTPYPNVNMPDLRRHRDSVQDDVELLIFRNYENEYRNYGRECKRYFEMGGWLGVTRFDIALFNSGSPSVPHSQNIDKFQVNTPTAPVPLKQ